MVPWWSLLVMYALGVCVVTALLDRLYDYLRFTGPFAFVVVVFWPLCGLAFLLDLLFQPFGKLFRR